MRALITGGAGFIGSSIAKELASNGTEVVVLDNLSSGYRNNIDGLSGIRLVEGDVRDGATVNAAVAGVDAVFHLAASVGNKRSIDIANLVATLGLEFNFRIMALDRDLGDKLPFLSVLTK